MIPEMIECDKCFSYYHVDCAKIEIHKVNREEWMCNMCNAKYGLEKDMRREKDQRMRDRD